MSRIPLRVRAVFLTCIGISRLLLVAGGGNTVFLVAGSGWLVRSMMLAWCKRAQ